MLQYLNSKHTATWRIYSGLSTAYQLLVTTGTSLELGEKYSSKVETKTCFLAAGVLHSKMLESLFPEPSKFQWPLRQYNDPLATTIMLTHQRAWCSKFWTTDLANGLSWSFLCSPHYIPVCYTSCRVINSSTKRGKNARALFFTALILYLALVIKL